jgi:hypothetical protein
MFGMAATMLSHCIKHVYAKLQLEKLCDTKVAFNFNLSTPWLLEETRPRYVYPQAIVCTMTTHLVAHMCDNMYPIHTFRAIQCVPIVRIVGF